MIVLVSLGTALVLVPLGALYWWALGTTMSALSESDRRRRMDAYTARQRGQ